jgi:hypothetical protein
LSLVKRSVGRAYFLFCGRAGAALGVADRFVRAVFPGLRVAAAFLLAGSGSRRFFGAAAREVVAAGRAGAVGRAGS